MNLISITSMAAFVTLLSIGIITACLIIIFATLRYGSSLPTAKPAKRIYVYERKQFFMTRTENSFYKGLYRATQGKYIIFAQVSLPTIVNIGGEDRRAARSRIDRKSVDFVLCDPEYMNPKLAIELDDSTHEWANRKQRDVLVEEVLQMVGLPLLRVDHRDNISIEELRERINQKISE